MTGIYSTCNIPGSLVVNNDATFHNNVQIDNILNVNNKITTGYFGSVVPSQFEDIEL